MNEPTAITAVLFKMLLSHQVELAEEFFAAPGRKFVIRASRRLGKSFLCCTLACLYALLRERAIIKYAAPTQKQVGEIIEPHMQDIAAALPPEWRPVYKQQRGRYVFPNGSFIGVAGCDKGNAERLRGPSADLAIVDEAATVDKLRYVVQSILLPQTMTRDGRMLIASTPPISPAHEFVKMDDEAQATGAHAFRTIYDATHITPELLEEYKAECGGEDTTDWRREYLAEIVVDEEMAVVPEFSRFELGGTTSSGDEVPAIVQPHTWPQYYDTYTIIDFGYHDLTAVGFFGWDFQANTIAQEDELYLHRTTSTDAVQLIRAKEAEVFPDKTPRARYGDGDAMLMADLNEAHGFLVMQTRKDDKDTAVNALRRACTGSASYRLKVHPRCTGTRAHLRNAVWNKRRTSFDRADDFGHFDGVDMMVYALRNIDTRHNPWPALYRGETPETHFIPAHRREARRGTNAALRKLVGK